MWALAVHHVSFSVRDLERARSFYGDLMGLEPVERPDLGIPGAWYRAGNAEIHLIAAPGPPESSEAELSPLANHVALAVDDYAATLDRLESRGLEIVRTSPERGQLWVQDPDGNVIEFIDPAASGRS